jgi:23S rRNA G2445 N2-methylase RlmL
VKPYYDDGKGIQIYNCDCREILPSLPKCDLVLTDPPYGVGLEYKSFVDTPENVKAVVSVAIPMAREKCDRMALTCGTCQIGFYPPQTGYCAGSTAQVAL